MNEIEQTNNEVKNYNRKVGSNIIAISIKCKRCDKKDKSGKFNSVKCLLHLPVITEENENIGSRNRWVDLHFTQDAFRSVPNECIVHRTEDLTTGMLYVRADKVQAPNVYKVKFNKDTGKYEYPKVWVRDNGVVGFEPYVVSQALFDYVAPDNSIEAEYTDVQDVFDVESE